MAVGEIVEQIIDVTKRVYRCQEPFEWQPSRPPQRNIAGNISRWNGRAHIGTDQSLAVSHNRHC